MLAETPYSFRTRSENEKGTNPEELIAAGHAGCFTMALAFGLQGRGFYADGARNRGRRYEPDGQGFRITGRYSPCGQSAQPRRSGICSPCQRGREDCPVSRVLNATITLEAKLIQ